MRFIHAAAAGLIAAALVASGAQAGKGGGGFSICDSANLKYLAPVTGFKPNGGLESSYTLDRGSLETVLAGHWPRAQATGTPDVTLLSAAWSYGQGKGDADHPHPIAQGYDANALGLVFDLFAKKADIGNGYVVRTITAADLKKAADPAAAVQTTLLGFGPNTKLSLDLLQTWVGDPSAAQIVCAWKDPHAAGASGQHGNKPQTDDVAPVAGGSGARRATNETNAPGGGSADEAVAHGDVLAWLWTQRKHAMLRDTAQSLEQILGHQIDPAFDAPKKSSASVAFTHDQLDHTANTFTMKAALGLGYQFDSDTDSLWHHGLVGYAGVSRTNNSNPAKIKNNTTDLYSGVGYVVTYFDRSDEPDFGFRAALHVQGDTDDKLGASLIYIGAQLSPWNTVVPCFGPDSAQIAGLVRVKCSVNFDLDYAHIFNAGDFTNLSQMEYARGGADMTVTIGGPDVSDSFVKYSGNPLYYVAAILSHLSLTGTYTALHDLSGTDAGLSRFDGSIDYDFGSDDGGQSTSISLTYVNGRADRTLERERAWGLSLNISY